MNVKLSMAISSHLSDAQHEIASSTPDSIKRANQRLIFIRLLISKNTDLSLYVPVDYLDSEWDAVFS
jgi:hypothetical protein